MATTATWCGDWCKVVAVFKSAFWQDRGASGVVRTHGPISIWWEGAGGAKSGEDSIALTGLGFGLSACRQVAALLTDAGGAKLRAFVERTLSPIFGKVVGEELLASHAKSWGVDDLTFAESGTQVSGELVYVPFSFSPLLYLSSARQHALFRICRTANFNAA